MDRNLAGLERIRVRVGRAYFIKELRLVYDIAVALGCLCSVVRHTCQKYASRRAWRKWINCRLLTVTAMLCVGKRRCK